MFLKSLAALFVLGIASEASAQEQDGTELKKRILLRVREKLVAERAAFLKKVEKIIDEEFAKAPAAKAPAGADPKLKELEKKLRLLDEQRETLAGEISKAKRLAEDEALRKEAEAGAPKDRAEAAKLAEKTFREALQLHEGKKFTESIRMFKKIHYMFPQTEIAHICAYNVACGYALSGQKDAALDWLEISIESGYDDFDHMRQDKDLDNLRSEKRYKKLLTDR